MPDVRNTINSGLPKLICFLSQKDGSNGRGSGTGKVKRVPQVCGTATQGRSRSSGQVKKLKTIVYTELSQQIVSPVISLSLKSRARATALTGGLPGSSSGPICFHKFHLSAISGFPSPVLGDAVACLFSQGPVVQQKH